MKRAVIISAAAALLLCVAVAQARVLVAEEEAETGRSLLQRTLDCTKVHRACSACRNQRIKGTKKTETVCSTCSLGWRLRKDGSGKLKTCGGSSHPAAKVISSQLSVVWQCRSCSCQSLAEAE
jgi:hypothetical protein